MMDLRAILVPLLPFYTYLGTLILTGTPEGVGAGMEPPKWMVAGDVVECEIEGIGILSNTVVVKGGSA